VIKMSSYPQDRLDGILELTDETGIIQHTKYTIIDRRHGYTSDDNARALLAVLRYHKLYKHQKSQILAKKYLTFLLGMHREDGKFHNFLGYNKNYQDEEGTEDSLGHILWALGATMNSTVTPEMKKLSKWLFDNSLPHARSFTSPRAKAYTILGLSEYQKSQPDDENIPPNTRFFSDQLVNQYHIESTENWKWYESYMTYANPRIPNALIKAHEQLSDDKYLKIAEESLNFAIETQFKDSVFHPIGTKGWYHKAGKKAEYDQQPLEASCMVDACLSLAPYSNKKNYHNIAIDTFHWYYGKNSNQISLINTSNYTCYDGLTRKGLNLNQGAESTISYYLAYLSLKRKNLL
jgi:hypothetical protein